MATSDISIKSRWNPHHLPIDFPIDFPMVKTSRPVARLRPSQRPPSPGAGPAPSDGAARGQEGGAWWISAKLVGAAGWNHDFCGDFAWLNLVAPWFFLGFQWFHTPILGWDLNDETWGCVFPNKDMTFNGGFVESWIWTSNSGVSRAFFP